MKNEIEKLWYLQTWSMNLEMFKKVFNRTGEDSNNEHSLANHMWRKYTAGGHNFLSFWKQCDSGNQQAIVNYLNSSEFEESYNKNMMVK